MRNSDSESGAADWYADRYQTVYISRNRWLFTSCVALSLASLQALALVTMMPLKTSTPFLIKEETSGAVTTLQPLSGDRAVTFNEAVRKYFLGRYVMLREGYDAADFADHYRGVEMMSNESERKSYRDSIAATNPTSPLVVYGNRAQRYIRINSIAFLGAEVAQIRFMALDQRSATPAKTSYGIATIAFVFGSVPATEAGRLVNPLGFTVTHYRVDQEVVP